MTHRAFRLLRRDILGRPCFLAGSPETAVKFAEQCIVSGEKPRIEQGRPDGRVLAALDQAVSDRPRRVPDLQPQVPEEIQHVFDNTQSLRWRILGGQEQQVDIAEGRQNAAAISAGRGDAQVLGEPQADFGGAMFE